MLGGWLLSSGSCRSPADSVLTVGVLKPTGNSAACAGPSGSYARYCRSCQLRIRPGTRQVTAVSLAELALQTRYNQRPPQFDHPEAVNRRGKPVAGGARATDLHDSQFAIGATLENAGPRYLGRAE